MNLDLFEDKLLQSAHEALQILLHLLGGKIR